MGFLQSIQKDQASQALVLERIVEELRSDFAKQVSFGEQSQRITVGKIEAATEALSGVNGALNGIRDYLGDSNKSIKRFEEGYDYQILKSFSRQIIRIIDRLDSRIAEVKDGDSKDELTETREELLELAPEREDHAALSELLKRWRAQASVEEDHWSEGSDLFTLSFDTDRRDILQNSQAVLDHLEKSYEELRLWFGADPVREMGRRPIRVVLYDSNEFDPTQRTKYFRNFSAIELGMAIIHPAPPTLLCCLIGRNG